MAAGTMGNTSRPLSNGTYNKSYSETLPLVVYLVVLAVHDKMKSNPKLVVSQNGQQAGRLVRFEMKDKSVKNIFCQGPNSDAEEEQN